MNQPKPAAKDNSGYLFPNENKANEKQPDYRGKLTKDGKEWLVSGWKRMKDGKEMISFSLTDPNSLPQRGSGAPRSQGASSGSTPFTPQQHSSAPSGDSGLDDLEGLFDGLT